MARTIFYFSNLSDKVLDTTAENIFTMLSSNADFPNPQPDLETLQTHLSDYRLALAEAALGDRRMVELKNERRNRLEQTLRLLALHVEQVAGGNIPLILSAGFGVAKSTSVLVGSLPHPEDLNARPGRHGSGMEQLRVKRNLRARLYRYEYRLADSAEWEVVQRTRSRVTLVGLQPLQQYEFRAAYLGTDSSVSYSDVVTAYAG